MILDSERKVEPVSIYFHSDNQCSNTVKVKGFSEVLFGVGGIKESENNKGMPKSSTFDYSKVQFAEVNIDAAKTVYFSTVGATFDGQCHLTMSFQPIENKNYEVIYQNENNRCVVTLGEISVLNGEYKLLPVPTFRRQKQPCKFFWN